jgi:hypothetical protein
MGSRDGVAGERQEHVVERVSAGLGLELGGRTRGDQAPAVEQPDGVGELVRLFQVLGGQEDRHAVDEQLAHGLPQVAATARVEPVGRLVEEDHPRTAHQRHGEIEPALHAPGVRPYSPVGRVDEPEPGQQLVHPGNGLTCRQVCEVGHQPQVLSPRQQLVDRGELPGHSDTAAYAVGLRPHVEPGDPGLSLICRNERGQDANHGGLTGAVGSQQRVHGAGGHDEVDATQNRLIPVRLRDPGDLDCCGSISHGHSVRG